MHKSYPPPSVHEKGTQAAQFPRSFSQSTGGMPGYGTSAIVAMDRSATISSGSSPSVGSLVPQRNPSGSERSLESVLHSSKQKVTAIERLLKGANLSERNSSLKRSTSLDLGTQ